MLTGGSGGEGAGVEGRYTVDNVVKILHQWRRRDGQCEVWARMVKRRRGLREEF